MTAETPDAVVEAALKELGPVVARPERMDSAVIARREWAVRLSTAIISAYLAAAPAEERVRRLGQLLAHVHLHMTNDEDFSPDELESDMRKMGEGKFIDTESLLLDARCDLDAAQSRIAALEAERAWRPIEDAPKDTGLLLYADCALELGHFNTKLNDWVANWDHRRLRRVTKWCAVSLPGTHPQAAEEDKGT